MVDKHTVKAFDKELQKLQFTVLEMGRLVSSQLKVTRDALVSQDAELAQTIIKNDPVVNALEHEVDRLTVRLLALRQPMGIDLRSIIAALKIATDLERIADYASNIAKHIGLLNSTQMNVEVQLIVHMLEKARDMLKDVLEAFIGSDVEKALDVWRRDKEIDSSYGELLTQLRDCMRREAKDIEQCTSLIFVARSVERMGDHIMNVSEHIYFQVHGEIFPGDPGVKS
jgi:phosphate transport system protein